MPRLSAVGISGLQAGEDVNDSPLIIRRLGRQLYVPVWEAMKAFTAERDEFTADEFWCVEHPPVFTLGLNGKPEHLLAPGDIPVIHVDRGGQVTYHGPGQIVVYILLDARRAGLGVRRMVTILEQSVVDLLESYGIAGYARSDAPGVYVAGRKIAALGLRIRRGGSYHGLAFNVDMDIEPFRRINPCGYPGLEVTQLKDLGVIAEQQQITDELLGHLIKNFGYTETKAATDLPFHLVMGAANARTESLQRSGSSAEAVCPQEQPGAGRQAERRGQNGADSGQDRTCHARGATAQARMDSRQVSRHAGSTEAEENPAEKPAAHRLRRGELPQSG